MDRLALIIVALTPCAGCALVSGLSSLDVAGDGGPQPTVDGGADAGDSSPVDAISPTDSATEDAKSDGGSFIEGGISPDGGPRPAGVLCGSISLSCSGSQTCCKSSSSYQCVNSACSNLPISCDDWADCGGGTKVCCVSLNLAQTAVSAVACEDQTSCVGKAMLCDPAASNPCPNGLKCNGPPPIGLSSNYLTCK